MVELQRAVEVTAAQLGDGADNVPADVGYDMTESACALPSLSSGLVALEVADLCAVGTTIICTKVEVKIRFGGIGQNVSAKLGTFWKVENMKKFN